MCICWPRIILLLFAGVLVFGAFPQTARAQAKGKMMQALPDERGGEERALQMRQVAKKMRAMARQSPPKGLTGDDKTWVKNYERWLRSNGARLKELALRWQSHLEKASGKAAQLSKTNQSFGLMGRQLVEQLLQENRQFRAHCEPLSPRTYQVEELLKTLN